MRQTRPHDCANGRQQKALDQQLPRETPARGAERKSHAHLVSAVGRADQEQVRDVHAGHEQDEHDHDADGQQRPGIRRRRPDRSDVPAAAGTRT